MDKIRKLSEVVDIGHLQQLQDSFAAMAHAATVVVEPGGAALTRPSNPHTFCQMMQETPKGAKYYLGIRTALCQENRRTGEPALVTCPRTGLTTAGVPILFKEEYLASWIIGPVLLQDPEKQQLEQAAILIGANEKAATGIFEGIPRTTEEELRHSFAFLQILNTTFAKKNEELQLVSSKCQNSAEILRRFVDASDAGMFVTDFETGELLMVNKRFQNIAGHTDPHVLGKKCWELAGPPGSTHFCKCCPRDALLDENGQPGPPVTWEKYLPFVETWMRVTSQAVIWADGRLAHMVTYLDVTGEHAMRQELAKLAFYDNQMGLPNGLKLQQDLRCGENGYERYLVCFDIGALRRVNDAYDRATGDLLLKTIVDWVGQQDFKIDDLYRIDGDAFGLYFQSGTADEAQRAADAIFTRFKKAWVLRRRGAQEITVFCRVSVAVINLPKEYSFVDVFTIVERMLDESRKQGDIAVHNKEMDRLNRERVRLEMSLKHCVQNGMRGFDVHFQPIVEPSAGTWKGLEALCRWTDPETQRAVPPLEFIKEAEQMGLIREVGLFVLDKAVRCCKDYGLDKVDGFFLSVNLSADQVMDANFVDHVSKVLRRYNFPGKNLIFEVTESMEFSFNPYTIRAIENLHFWGVRFSLDDFGTGYSSFNNLKNLPVSILKTERDFIIDIEKDTYMQYFFYSIAELAHAADMRLIAEGVETEEQLAILLMNGADFVQGYYFAKPMPARQIGQNLDKFHHVDPSFYRLNNARLTQHIFSGKNAYLLSPSLFRISNQSMQSLLQHADLNAAFDEVVKTVGSHFAVARSYVFLRQEGTFFKCSHEWCAPGIPPQAKLVGTADISAATLSWLPALQKDQMIVCADTALLPEDIRILVQPFGVKALAVLPIMDGEELLGFVGLDDTEFREWLPEEIAMLRSLCMVMAGSLKREGLKKQLYQTDVRFSDVLDNMGIAILITDPKSGDIVWKNKSVHALYSIPTEVRGGKCYTVLHQRDTACGFCKVPQLLESGEAKQCTWEYYNEKTDRYYMLNDSLVHWEGGGRKMHMQYGLDITEIKRAQKKAEHFAAPESPSDTMNRSTLVLAMQNQLQQAAATGQPLSMVFVTIDSLKNANAIFGHEVGNQLILKTVNALREVMSPQDLMGRYCGDEFIVLMPGKTKEDAQRLAEKARVIMRESQGQPFGHDYSFSYGVVENTELPDDDGEQAVDAVVTLADGRIQIYKKAKGT